MAMLLVICDHALLRTQKGVYDLNQALLRPYLKNE